MKSPESHCIPGVFFLASPNQFSLATWTAWLPTACSTLQNENENKVLRITIWDTGGDPAGITEAQMQWDLTRLPWSDLKIAATLKIVKERIIGGGYSQSQNVLLTFHTHCYMVHIQHGQSLKLWVICASNNFFPLPLAFVFPLALRQQPIRLLLKPFVFKCQPIRRQLP